MKFEEQFPSLKNIGSYGDYVEVDEDIDQETLWINREDIEKHCLDKQKVKDVIENLNNIDITSEDYGTIYTKDLLKELGLNNE